MVRNTEEAQGARALVTPLKDEPPLSAQTILIDDGEIEIAVPRDRAGSFEPQLIRKGQTGSKALMIEF